LNQTNQINEMNQINPAHHERQIGGQRLPCSLSGARIYFVSLVRRNKQTNKTRQAVRQSADGLSDLPDYGSD
jgi:hypothetical protein